jgi:hypothetical protein
VTEAIEFGIRTPATSARIRRENLLEALRAQWPPPVDRDRLFREARNEVVGRFLKEVAPR